MENDKLLKHINSFGYSLDIITHNLWIHNMRKTKRCLCVDDFGVKYHSQEDSQHLINSLKETYELKVSFSGKNYCGLTVDWQYVQDYVDVLMPTFVEKML